MAEPDATKIAFCVFVKTKEPRIEWLFAERSAKGRPEYVETIRVVSENVAAGIFYKPPGKQFAIIYKIRPGVLPSFG